MQCELISWREVQRLCQRLARQLKASGYRPDIVVAIGRGGLVPARLVCDYLDITALTSIRIEHYLTGSTRQAQAVIRYPLCTDIRDQKVLLMDDVNDSGDTLEVALAHLHTFHPRMIRTAVMHHKTTTHTDVNYFARKIIKWRWLIYPWAIHEDIPTFLRQLIPPPASSEEARKQLLERFGIRISARCLQEVYELMPTP